MRLYLIRQKGLQYRFHVHAVAALKQEDIPRLGKPPQHGQQFILVLERAAPGIGHSAGDAAAAQSLSEMTRNVVEYGVVQCCVPLPRYRYYVLAIILYHYIIFRGGENNLLYLFRTRFFRQGHLLRQMSFLFRLVLITIETRTSDSLTEEI